MLDVGLGRFLCLPDFNSPGVSQREKVMDQTWAFWINHSGWIVAP